MMTMFSSRNWREYPQRYRLEAVEIQEERQDLFPAAHRSTPKRATPNAEMVDLPETGKVITYTVIRVAPAQWGDMAPYALAIVELTDGTRLMAQMTDCDVDKVKIGMEVRLEFRRIQKEGTHGVIELRLQVRAEVVLV